MGRVFCWSLICWSLRWYINEILLQQQQMVGGAPDGLSDGWSLRWLLVSQMVVGLSPNLLVSQIVVRAPLEEISIELL